jgi:hypothetical protein
MLFYRINVENNIILQNNLNPDRMKKILLLSTIIFQSLFSAAQRFEWVSHSTQSVVPTNYSPDAVDAAGNIYTLISTGSAGAIIQGDTIAGLTAGDGVIIAKFGPSGNFLWGKMVSPDGGGIQGHKIAVDNSGAVYSTFVFANGGNVNMNDTVFPATGAGVIIKLDSSGNFVRARIYTAHAICIVCLATDLYISYDYTVAKLDSTLNTVWSVVGTNGGISFSYSGGEGDLFVSANGELVASAVEEGNSTGAMPFGNDSIYFTIGGFNEIAVVKMDTSGQVLWSRTQSLSTPLAVCLDSHSNVYVGINNATTQNIFAGDTLFNGSAYSALLKWDSTGTPLWGRGLYPTNGIKLYDMAVNAQDELLISGHAQGNSDISFNNDTLLPGNNNCFLMKISPAGNFIWYKRNEPLPGSTADADGIAVRNGNEYILAGSTHNPATYEFGCVSYTAASFSNFITLISENPEVYPAASFSFSVINDTTYTFTDASTNATSWHWDFGDGDTSNLQNPSHNFTSGGNYTVILTAYNGPCSATDTLHIIGVGINETANAESFSVHPNPSQGNFTISFPGSKDKISIEIFTTLGEKIFSDTTCASEKEINIKSACVGIYLMKVFDEKKYYCKKIILTHD